MPPRSLSVSTNTAIRGALIDETYAVFRDWDFTQSPRLNLRRVAEHNSIGVSSSDWARKVAEVINHRFEPEGRDRPLVDLAIAGCDRDIWDPLLLFHMTRNDFLMWDFLVHWLYPQFTQGAYRLHTEDVTQYLGSPSKKKGVGWSGRWAESTTSRVASGLLRMAADFGLLAGRRHKEFVSYHLPEESFIYLLHAMADVESNARRITNAEDWQMFLMDSADVERELLRLHQFCKLHFKVVGSLWPSSSWPMDLPRTTQGA